MKNILKTILKLTFISQMIILSSCEAEKEIIKSNKFIVRKFSMKEFTKNENLKLIEAVNKIKSLRSDTTIENSRIVYDEQSGLYFDDEKGIYIKNEELESYTFPIIRTSSLEKVQNICFNLTEDGDYDVFLVKYDFTIEEAEGLTADELKNREKEFITLLKDGQIVDFFRYVCIDILLYVTYDIDAPLDQGELTGNNGNVSGSYTTTITISTTCFFTSDNGGSSGSTGDGGSVSSGNDAGGISDENGNIITGSIIDDTEAQNPGSMPLGWMLDWFENGLDEEIQLPIYSTYPQMRNFLAMNNCNTQSQEFVIQLINEISNGRTLLNLETFDEQITPINLPLCIEAVLNDIKNLNSEKFSDVIELFTAKNPVALNYNWLIRKGPLAGDNPAFTVSGATNGNILTTLNETYLPLSSELSVAKTLMHEAFHAYLVSVFENSNIDKSYANLLNEYAKLFDPEQANDLHHYAFIRLNVIDEIAIALKEYGISKGYDLSDQYYEDMAWGGLEDTNAFQQLPEDDQIRIVDRIAAEYNSNDYNGATPQTPKACP